MSSSSSRPRSTRVRTRSSSPSRLKHSTRERTRSSSPSRLRYDADINDNMSSPELSPCPPASSRVVSEAAESTRSSERRRSGSGDRRSQPRRRSRGRADDDDRHGSGNRHRSSSGSIPSEESSRYRSRGEHSSASERRAAYSRTREHRERRLLEEASGTSHQVVSDEDRSGELGGPSSRSLGNSSRSSYDDENERIREMRARRLRSERERERRSGDDRHHGSYDDRRSSDDRHHGSHDDRRTTSSRRDREHRRDRDSRSEKHRHKSSTDESSSRKESEDLDLLRKERSSRRSRDHESESARGARDHSPSGSSARSRGSRESSPSSLSRGSGHRSRRDETDTHNRPERSEYRKDREREQNRHHRREKESRDRDEDKHRTEKRDRDHRRSRREREISESSLASTGSTRRHSHSDDQDDHRRRARDRPPRERSEREDYGERTEDRHGRERRRYGSSSTGTDSDVRLASRSRVRDRDHRTIPRRTRSGDISSINRSSGGDHEVSDSNATRTGPISQFLDPVRRPPGRSKSDDELNLSMTVGVDFEGSHSNFVQGQDMHCQKDSRPIRGDAGGTRTTREVMHSFVASETQAKESKNGKSTSKRPSHNEKNASSTDDMITSAPQNNFLDMDRKPKARREGKGGVTNDWKALKNVNDDLQPEKQNTDSDFCDDENDEKLQEWSVRVSVISAVDLPVNVVPNMPLCPILKLGLAKIPINDDSENDGGSSVSAKVGLDRLSHDLNEKGVASVDCDELRLTSSKVLSKRDNGSVDFHQEFRWDGVKHPIGTALCVEVCAQGCQTPANFEESPKTSAFHDAFRLPPDVATTTDPTSHMKYGNVDRTKVNIFADPDSNDSNPVRPIQRNVSGSDDDPVNQSGGLRGFWRKATSRKAAELEAANAAAAVARMLVEEDNAGKAGPRGSPSQSTLAQPQGSSTLPRMSSVPQADYNVALQSAKSSGQPEMTEDLRLGSVVIPLTSIALETAMNKNEAARVEQWYQLKTADDSETKSELKKPSLLLEINFSSPEVLDDSEDEMDDYDENRDFKANKDNSEASATTKASFAKRATRNARIQLEKEEKPHDESKLEDPVLEPGVIDFIAVVGARDIGDQKNDDGSKGWVESTPKCGILEQFPPSNEAHEKAGRNAILPNMLEWFCFPEGCRLWRGSGPPSHFDLNLKRFSASSPPNVASSVAAFDACLNCTTSFSWFVIASNSDEYGSQLVKTYGAVIRFYAPAPPGIDPTQADFVGSQNISSVKQAGASTKRLWVPLGICLTSNLPIVGVMEAMLLRLCEELVMKVGGNSTECPPKLSEIHESLGKLILNYQKPIAGVVNCSVPFLTGERFLLTLPPPTGMSALPHGHAVVSVCRLLGAEGLNFLLAAVLSESKILIHSNDIADITMVAEVITSLCYPFTWSLPYIPILPVDMLEFVEAPLSYLLGVPSCHIKLIDPNALEDVVVVDLDNGFSSANYADSRRGAAASRSPPPLPASVATNISKAVYRLLRAEEEVEQEYGVGNYSGGAALPRLETESLAERQFRIAVAIQISSLLRGYHDCVGPVFNRDKFLKIAPALLEDKREAAGGIGSALGAARGNGSLGSSSASKQKVVSPLSKRFLSTLVNTQNFMQLMERLESDDTAFFHEIMESFEGTPGDSKAVRSKVDNAFDKSDRTLAQLTKALQKVEDKIPTYPVDKANGLHSNGDFDDDDFFFEEEDTGFENFDDYQHGPESMASMDGNMISSFTGQLLKPFEPDGTGAVEKVASATAKVGQSLEEKLSSQPQPSEPEKKIWQLRKLFSIPMDVSSDTSEKVKLREAIGERRYRAWKMAQDRQAGGDDDFSVMSEDLHASRQGDSLDLRSLITSASSATYDMSDSGSLASSRASSTLSPEQQRVQDAKNRDVIRRCLNRARGDDDAGLPRKENDGSNPFVENGRDLIAEAEKALNNPSAQRFLLSILGQRSTMENQRGRPSRRTSISSQSTVSRLQPIAFDCLIRLSCAMLDSCMEYKEYEYAYRLLTHTAGFIMVLQVEEGDDEHHAKQVISMTSRIGLHPIFADLGVWEKVMSLHLHARESEKKSEANPTAIVDSSDDEDESAIEYEAAVATLYEMLGYGIPGEDLTRFAILASKEYGWFVDDRGKQLLMLARRISVRRESVAVATAGNTGDIEMIRSGQDGGQSQDDGDAAIDTDNESLKFTEISWCHPAAPSSQSTIRSSSEGDMEAPNVSDYMKRSSITALTAFGSSVVVTGGLDGSVFLAHSISESGKRDGTEPTVRGIHLDWGSASRASVGSSSDGEYGVGAITCLAAASGNGHHSSVKHSSKDVGGGISEEEMVASMEGSRVVAGTTAGDLRVWSVKDVYSAVALAKKGEEADDASKNFLGGGNASTRLRFSLRGRALSGHRGGVTCIDVPSHIYRADSLVTGGADGLIKLWSLRAPTGGRRTGTTNTSETESNAPQRGRGGDALSILNGHRGRILCVKTAWHGDRLLSGSSDRTLRVWDLAGGGGKSLHTLCGHFGWVTKVQYWGPNTIVSAATDRAIALWDARVRNSPLFMLRHHHSPISDLLVGSRTDPQMISAAADGTVATWDFRALSGPTMENNSNAKDSNKHCNVVRYPAATMRHNAIESDIKKAAAGPILLARGILNPMNNFLSVGTDAVVREWDVASGQLVEETPTGHCDVISSFSSFDDGNTLSPAVDSIDVRNEGTISSSWDGTVRIRKVVR